MFHTRRGKARKSIGRKMQRSGLKDKISVLGLLCSRKMGGDWKQKRPTSAFRKYTTIRHVDKAEKTFQENCSFKSLGRSSLARAFLKWSCPLNGKGSFLKGFSVNEAKAGKRGDCPGHLLMSNMPSHETGQFVCAGSLTESPVHLACWAQHQL